MSHGIFRNHNIIRRQRKYQNKLKFYSVWAFREHFTTLQKYNRVKFLKNNKSFTNTILQEFIRRHKHKHKNQHKNNTIEKRNIALRYKIITLGAN